MKRQKNYYKNKILKAFEGIEIGIIIFFFIEKDFII